MPHRHASSRNLVRSNSAHQLKSDPQLHVYVDSVSRPNDRQTTLAGYGIYLPEYSIRVSEPLPGSDQGPHRAQLRSFHAALELVHGIRARAVLIHIPSMYVFDSFKNHLQQWHENEWRMHSGHIIPHRRLWEDIYLLKAIFADRGVTIQVKKRSSKHDERMKVAYKLAKHGLTLHIQCRLCFKIHGRQYYNHHCEPVCNLDGCSNRRHKNFQDYSLHLSKHHRRVCRRDDCEMEFECFSQRELDEHVGEHHGERPYSCDFCFKTYRHKHRLTRHMKNRCKRAKRCTHCGLRFGSIGSMKHHYARHPEHRFSDDEEDEDEDERDEDEDERDDERDEGMMSSGVEVGMTPVQGRFGDSGESDESSSSSTSDDEVGYGFGGSL